jgi:hypothetical protein
MYIFTRLILEYVGWFHAQIIGGLDIFIRGRAGRLIANWFFGLQISYFFRECFSPHNNVIFSAVLFLFREC